MIKNISENVSQLFASWIREPKGRWRLVCHAPDFDAAWRLLLREKTLGRFCEKIVKRAGDHP